MNKKNIFSIILVSLVVVSILVFGCSNTDKISAGVQSNGPEVLKIKGLYIGMDIDEACKIVNQLSNSSCTVEENTFLGSTYAVANSDSLATLSLWVTAGPDRKTDSIHIGHLIVDKLFNSDGVEGKDFVQEFINSYRIPKMETQVDENGKLFWQFISTKGYKLTIFQNKSIEIKAIPKRNEMKFN